MANGEKENVVLCCVAQDMPIKAHDGDAGFDLTAISDPNIVGLEDPDNEGFYFKIDYVEYDTGVKISPPENIYSVVLPRSSISKKNLELANSEALIDTGYRDTIKLRFNYVAQPWDYEVTVEKISVSVDADKIYKKGDRIGQLVFKEHVPVTLRKVSEKEFLFDDSTRGRGGFGSTGE